VHTCRHQHHMRSVCGQKSETLSAEMSGETQVKPAAQYGFVSIQTRQTRAEKAQFGDADRGPSLHTSVLLPPWPVSLRFKM
jgi:hypothetical protein